MKSITSLLSEIEMQYFLMSDYVILKKNKRYLVIKDREGIFKKVDYQSFGEVYDVLIDKLPHCDIWGNTVLTGYECVHLGACVFIVRKEKMQYIKQIVDRVKGRKN